MTARKDIVFDFRRRLLDGGFTGAVSLDAPLAPLTYYKIGGPAAVLAEVPKVEDLAILRNLLSDSPLPCFVMGAGTNLLVADRGFPGVVIRLGDGFAKLESPDEGNMVRCGAAVPLARLVRDGVRMGMAGVERLAGIPGWVGGALYMNAGTHGRYFGEMVESVQVYTTSSGESVVNRDDCAFGYRSSRFQNSEEIILACSIRVGSADPEELAAEVERRLGHRRQTQPVDIPSCGCVFKNPPGEISAARLIEDAGLKGARHGGAVISDKHANFVVNDRQATALDILALMAEARRKVFDLTGVKLVPEVQAVGFDDPIEVMLDAWEQG